MSYLTKLEYLSIRNGSHRINKLENTSLKVIYISDNNIKNIEKLINLEKNYCCEYNYDDIIKPKKKI